jgi:hypothetical protein
VLPWRSVQNAQAQSQAFISKPRQPPLPRSCPRLNPIELHTCMKSYAAHETTGNRVPDLRFSRRLRFCAPKLQREHASWCGAAHAVPTHLHRPS